MTNSAKKQKNTVQITSRKFCWWDSLHRTLRSHQKNASSTAEYISNEITKKNTNLRARFSSILKCYGIRFCILRDFCWLCSQPIVEISISRTYNLILQKHKNPRDKSKSTQSRKGHDRYLARNRENSMINTSMREREREGEAHKIKEDGDINK